MGLLWRSDVEVNGSRVAGRGSISTARTPDIFNTVNMSPRTKPFPTCQLYLIPELYVNCERERFLILSRLPIFLHVQYWVMAFIPILTSVLTQPIAP